MHRGKSTVANKLAALTFVTGVALILGLVSAAPAAAQAYGSLKGKVVDDKGKFAAGAEVTITSDNDQFRPAQVLTDRDGVYGMDRLPFGTYRIEARKGTLIGKLADPIKVLAGTIAAVPDIPMHVAKPEELKKVTAEDVAKVAAENEEKKKVAADLEAADASMTAGHYDEAVTRMNNVIAARPTCGPCYVKLGDAHGKKADQAEAEKAYLKAIELGPEKEIAGAYASLATLYNAQNKLEEAAKMSAKANDLLDAAGGGNASTAYNQGIIFWNQGDKMAEAEAQFRKAVKLDPKMADAQYYLGMALVNQGKMAEAKAPFLEYMKLDPKGKFAGDVKEMLAIIK
jgi:tetratricopeptide (TPR) repeat protein